MDMYGRRRAYSACERPYSLLKCSAERHRPPLRTYCRQLCACHGRSPSRTSVAESAVLGSKANSSPPVCKASSPPCHLPPLRAAHSAESLRSAVSKSLSSCRSASVIAVATSASVPRRDSTNHITAPPTTNVATNTMPRRVEGLRLGNSIVLICFWFFRCP